MNENGLIPKILLLGNYGFFLEVFFATVIVLLSAKKRKYWYIVLLVGAAAGFPFYYLPQLTIGPFTFDYLLVLLPIYVLMLLVYKEPPVLILFAVVAAWAVQHGTWNTLGLIYDLIPNAKDLSTTTAYTIYLSTFVFIYGVLAIFFYQLKIKLYYSKRQFVSFFFALAFIAVAFLVAQLIQEWSWPLRLYSLLISVLSLAIMFGYPRLSELAMKERGLLDEKKSLELLLENQAKQQRLSSEAIEVVNMKYHDLKNQLLYLKRSNNEKELEKTEKELDVFSSIARTGNEAIDVVVMQKSLLCSEKNIRLSCIIDGEEANFIGKTDLISIFGNILDNAIEAVEKEEKEYRLIKLRAGKVRDFYLIEEENYTTTPVKFGSSGLPLSIKGDEANHGFGLKSVRYAAEKYNGELSLGYEEGIFSLRLLFPLSKAD